MNYDDIIRFCQKNHQYLIYIGIGCALGHHAVAAPVHQQYPPFVHAWPGQRLCILIDPALESPTRVATHFENSSDPESAFFEVAPTANFFSYKETTFLLLRKEFRWGAPAEIRFINRMCSHVLEKGTHMIVQDYTGMDIQPYYPVNLYGMPLVEHVLFDVTHGDGSCWVEFDKVEIPQDKTFDFINPRYLPLTTLARHASNRLLIEQMTQRANTVMYYLHYTYETMRGTAVRTDIRFPYDKLAPLCFIYGYPVVQSLDVLAGLIGDILADFAAVSDTDMTPESIIELTNSSNSQMGTALRALTAAAAKS